MMISFDCIFFKLRDFDSKREHTRNLEYEDDKLSKLSQRHSSQF